MVMFLNTETSAALFHSEDLFVVTTLSSIHGAMTFGPARSLEPSMPFDLLFFYCTIAESIAKHLKYSPTTPLPRCQKAAPANPPDIACAALRETFFVSSGIAVAYLNVVQRRAAADGIPFDLSYAVAVAALAFDAETLARIARSEGKRYAPSDDWDDFLRGFNAP
ncbi:MAG TPA: hypothetical protein VHY91_12055 [Pirellulales bacterium]|jgi:hypothetical protein|nr:hypothetical protein [Pirellulales bacterium]